MKKLLIEFVEFVEGCVSVVRNLLHGHLDEQWTVIPEPEAAPTPAPKPCARADLTAEDLLRFMKAQGRSTDIFDQYIKTEIRREVSTDE